MEGGSESYLESWRFERSREQPERARELEMRKRQKGEYWSKLIRPELQGGPKDMWSERVKKKRGVGKGSDKR